MPRKPIECEHSMCSGDPIIINNAASDSKLLVLENKVVPRDLSAFSTIASIGDNTYIFVDDNGVAKKISAKTITGTLTEDLVATVSVGGVDAGTKFDAGTSFEAILNKLFIRSTTAVLQSIAITQAPTKVGYIQGEVFDPTGMEITATYDDGTTRIITGYTYSPSVELTTADTKITISYTENAVTKTATQSISVSSGATVDVYYGALDEVPLTLYGLTKVSASAPIVGVYKQHINAGNVETGQAQYPTFAVPDTYTVTKIEADGVSFTLPMECVENGGYKIYYLVTPTYDEDEGGIDYNITIS